MNKKGQISLLLTLLILPLLIAIPDIPKSYAHAFVLGSNPAPSSSLKKPPSQVEVDFIEPIDIKHSQIKVLDSNGKEIQNNDFHYVGTDQSKTAVTLPSGIPNGIYTVYTKVLDQTDGHTTTNAFVFAIGEPVPQTQKHAKESVSFSDIVSIPDTIARYPSLVGQIIVAGALFSFLWLWRPLSKIPALKNTFEQTRVKIDHGMAKLVLIGSIIILAGDFAMITSVAISINAGIIDAINTKFGNLWTLRLILSSALFGIALIIYLKQRKSGEVLSMSRAFILFGLAIAVLTTTTLISHGAATNKALPPIFDFVHNVVASLWIGSVVYLAFVVAPRLKKMQDERVSISVLALIIPRFSIVVTALLGVVLMTGPSLLYVLENNLSITLASIYGEILVIKLSLAGAMIGIGAFNQRIIHRKAFEALLSDKGSVLSRPEAQDSTVHVVLSNVGRPILSAFNKTVKIEAIIGFVLIASIAFLVDSGLPGIQFQNELAQQQHQIPKIFAFANQLTLYQNKFTDTGFTDNGDRIVLTIEPYYAGKNNVIISYLDPNNNPIKINSTQITLNQVNKGIGPLVEKNAVMVSQGVFSFDTAAFAIPGHWQAQVEGITTQAGALNVVTTFDNLYVKPNLNQLQANITEFKMPDKAMPLYPIYDPIRNAIWVGDTAIGSGRIWEFDLGSKHYTEHKINGTNIITATAMDFNNNIWYVDPINKILGYYEPDSGKDKKYFLPKNATVSGLAIDDSNNPWITISSTNQILKFDVKTKTFHSINLPENSMPLGLSIDQSTGQIWIAESGTGKIANIDPSQSYKITEHSPTNDTLASPTAILFDPVTGKVFVSEHDGQDIAVFDPLIKTFQRFDTDPKGLPFGMAFDANHDLWLAQHTLDKIAVVDPRTGDTNEFNIPSSSSFTQWVTSTPNGDIILAEQRANALGILSSGLIPGYVRNTVQQNTALGVPLGFSFADIVGPSIAGGLIAVAFFYSKSVIDLKNSENLVRKIDIINNNTGRAY